MRDPEMTKWRLTGFGGSVGHESFERLITEARVSKNGSYLQLLIRLPGEEKHIVLSLLQRELREFLGDEDGPHGMVEHVRLETDAASDVAYQEHERVAVAG